MCLANNLIQLFLAEGLHYQSDILQLNSFRTPPTHEQFRIINHDVQVGGIIKISAFAGEFCKGLGEGGGGGKDNPQKKPSD